MQISGSMTALVTPFKNGDIDENTYIDLIKRQINNNIDFVVPVGTTGESATLTHEEHKLCVKIAIETCKGSKTGVIAGAGSNNTQESVQLASYAQSIGADGILAVCPYYNKPNQEGLYRHYMKIDEHLDIPLLAYNVPGRTGVDLLADTMTRLYNDSKNIKYIKEATGSMDRCVQLLAQNKNLNVISGDDMINYPLMANGAIGCISVTSNILPSQISDLIHLALDKNFAQSKQINDDLYDMNRVLFTDSNPIPIKAMMHIAGLLPSLEFRLPLVEPSTQIYKNLEKVFANYESQMKGNK